jgi:hypothetical protein
MSAHQAICTSSADYEALAKTVASLFPAPSRPEYEIGRLPMRIDTNSQRRPKPYQPFSAYYDDADNAHDPLIKSANKQC